MGKDSAALYIPCAENTYSSICAHIIEAFSPYNFERCLPFLVDPPRTGEGVADVLCFCNYNVMLHAAFPREKKSVYPARRTQVFLWVNTWPKNAKSATVGLGLHGRVVDHTPLPHGLFRYRNNATCESTLKGSSSDKCDFCFFCTNVLARLLLKISHIVRICGQRPPFFFFFCLICIYSGHTYRASSG